MLLYARVYVYEHPILLRCVLNAATETLSFIIYISCNVHLRKASLCYVR